MKNASRIAFAALLVFAASPLGAAQNPSAAQEQLPPGAGAAPAAAAPPQVAPGAPASRWGAKYHWLYEDPYGGVPGYSYGTATTKYYPWPGIEYNGPRYHGFRPGWFGAGYPTSDFGGFWW